MLLRAPALSRLGLLCLVATFACKPEPTPTTTPDPAGDPDGPTTNTVEPTEPVEPSEPSEPTEPTPPAVDPDTPVESDDVDADTTAVASTGDGDAPAEATPSSDPKQPEPLPKPTYALSGPKCQQSFSVGNKVKSFRLPSIESGKTISSTGYRNRVVMINFWGTWCKPCLEELPEFDRLYRKYRKHGFTLVAVATDEEPELVQAFIDKHKLKAKIALSGEEAAGAYARPAFPFSVIVDGSGKVVAAYDFIDKNCMGDLEQVIRDELEKLAR